MITLKNVSKKVIRDDREVEVLSNINLQLGDKGLVVLRGGKEAGKTCLLRMIAQLDNITDGNIFVDGVDIGLLSNKEIENYRTHYVGMVMGKDDILPDLTIEENVAIGTAFGRIKPKKEVLDMLYESLGIKNVTKRKAKECTDEEKVCANIARLIIKSPKVLMVDDFEDIVETDTMLRIWRLLKELSETHLVIIVSDSDPYISKFADRVVTINMGKIVSSSGKNKVNEESSAKQDILDKSIFLRKHRFTLSATWKILKQMLFSNGLSMLKTITFAVLLTMGFVLSASLAVFNQYHTIAKSSVSHGDKYIEFYKGENADNRTELNYDTTMGESVIAELQKEKLSYMVAKHSVNWQTNVGGDGLVIKSLITNSQELTIYEKNKFDQKILAGKYTGSGAIANDEAHGTSIVISDYMAEVIINNGITNGFTANQNTSGKFRDQKLYDALTNPKNQQQLVNFKINGINYSIVGSYETDFDKYVDKDLTVKKDKKEIFEYNLKNVYSVIHVNTNFYNVNPKLVAMLEIDTNSISGYDPSNKFVELSMDKSKTTVINSGTIMNWRVYDEIGDGFSHQALSGGGVYVSADIMQNILNRTSKYKNITIEEVVNNRKTILSSIDSGLVANYRKIRIESDSISGKNLNILGIISNTEKRNTIIVYGGKKSESLGSSRSTFEYLYIDQNFVTDGVIMPVEMFNANNIEQVIRTMSANGYNVSTLATDTILEIGSVLSKLVVVFLAAGAACIVFIILLFIRYIRKMYMKNTKMYGLLRSLGCTKLNISVSIVIIATLSMLAVLFVGVGFSWIITLIANAIMSGIFTFSVSIFSINVFILLSFMFVMPLTTIIITPVQCQEFQNLMPLYMLKYDDVFGNKSEHKKKEKTKNEDKKETSDLAADDENIEENK